MLMNPAMRHLTLVTVSALLLFTPLALSVGSGENPGAEPSVGDSASVADTTEPAAVLSGGMAADTGDVEAPSEAGAAVDTSGTETPSATRAAVDTSGTEGPSTTGAAVDTSYMEAPSTTGAAVDTSYMEAPPEAVADADTTDAVAPGDTLSASSGDTSAPAPAAPYEPPSGVGFRPPVSPTGSFVRPWSYFTPRSQRGLRPLAALPPVLPIQNLPFNRRTEVDLSTGFVRVQTQAGDHLAYTSYVSGIDGFAATETDLAVREHWKGKVIAALDQEGVGEAGGLLDIDIPMPLPGPFVRAIGPGANLKVRGSERITFGGQTSYVVDALEQESGPASRFPQLDMEQQLTVNLEGTIGRKIHVYVDHRSGGETFGAAKANQIRVRYEGDEDEIIQRIELGEVNLTLPGTEFVSYSGHHEGLFGAKVTSKIGKLDLVTIASKEEGKSAGASFTGGAESASLEIEDVGYRQNTFFAPDSTVLKDPEVQFASLTVYIDDLDGTNDAETSAVPGRAFLNDPSDTTAPAGPSKGGMFNELFELVDYERVKTDLGVQLGFIEFLRHVPDNSVVAVSYTTTTGRAVGGIGDDGKLRLKMIKKDTGIDQEWERIRNRELKNIYYLGAEDIPKEGFELTIRRRSSSGEDLDVNEDGIPYLRIFGLDTEDLAGNPTPDNIIDHDRINFGKGYLVFPHYTPFCPAYDESTNFYYDEGSPAYTEYASELDPTNCLVYSEESFDPNDDEYYIEVNYDRPRTTFYLGHMNIIKNSEVVRVNGVELTQGRDYTIYYPAGQLTLLSEEAKDPDATVTVDFDYKPFGVGGEKTLLGTRGVYNWSENIQLGTTWMYQSKGTADDRPRLGEEPSRTIVGDVNLTAEFEPEFMTTMVDAIPLVDTDAPSHLKVSGETAVSIPEPNTRGFVSIDDMEGTENVSMLGVTRRLWVPCSIPIDEFGEPAVAASDRQYISWYNPDRLVRKGDLFPYLPDQEADDIQSVLALYDYHAEESWGGGDWAGLMRLVSKSGNDYSDYEFFEFWIDAGASPEGTIHIDLGTISEDFYPLRAPNGEWDTEDYDRNGFDADEDTGLDNCCSTGQCQSQVDPCTDDAPPAAPSDDYEYDYTNDPDNYRHINGTEDNDRLDTEDLNGNYIADHENRYWTLTVDLADDTFLVVDNNDYEEPAKRTDWRLYRIPLGEAEAIGGIANWEVIRSARVWFEGLNVSDNPVLIGSLDIVGSQWEPMPIRGADVNESFGVTAKNTKEDLDYVPPFDPGVDEETNIPKREQSLALLFENLAGGHEGLARKLLYSDEDYTRYGSLEFYVRGVPDTGCIDVGEGTVFFLRLGADSLNYYEYSLEPVAEWQQDPSSGRNRLTIPFTSFTNLKLDEYEQADTVSVWGDTTTIKGERFTRVGWPSLSRVRELAVGVRNANDPGFGDPISGEIWVDDIRLSDVRKEIGWARRTTVDAKFADLATIRFDMRNVDGNFHTLKQQHGSGQSNVSYNVNGTVNADQFAEGLGVAAPVTFSWKKTETRPQFSTGSDVVLSDEQSEKERTQSLDTSLAASLSRKRQSPDFWTHLLVDGVSLRASVSDRKQLGPTAADTSRTVRGRLSYKYNPSRQGLRVFRETQLFLKPTSLRFSLDGYVRHTLQYNIASDGLKTKRTDNLERKLNGEGNIDFQPLENLKTSHSVSFARDLSYVNRSLWNRNIGMETDRDYTNSLTFNARFGNWFAPQYSFTSSFNDDHIPVRRFSGRSNHEIRTSFELRKLLGSGSSSSSPRGRPGRERDRRGDDVPPPRGGPSERPDEGSPAGGEAEAANGEASDDDETAQPSDELPGDGEEGSEEDMETPEEGPGFAVLMDPVLAFLRKMDAIDVGYNIRRSWHHNQILPSDELEGWTYRTGLAVDYEGDGWTEEHGISLGTGVRITSDIRIKGDYDRTVTNELSRSRNQETFKFIGTAVQTEEMRESTKGSVSWSGLEDVGPLSTLFRSMRARSGVELNRSYTGPNENPNRRTKNFLLNPIVSLDTTFKNGVTTSFSWDRTNKKTFNLTGAGSVNEVRTSAMSISVNYRFSAPQGLKLPFFGQKLRFESNLDTSFTLRTGSSETRTAATEEGLQIAEPTAANSDLSFTADASYSFSRNVSGGLQFSFSQSKDEKKDQTRRTIGLHLSAEFKF